MPTPNAPTLTFAGIDLPVWESNQAAWASRAIPLGEYSPFGDTNVNYFSDAAHLGLPNPARQPEVEPGVLRWPIGAARWAVFHTVLTAAKLDAVEAAVGAGPGTLAIADGRSGKSISTSMYLLPPRPLPGGATINNEPAFIATLVDIRYLWWFKLVSIDPKPSSWANLFSTLSTALGITLNGDTTIEAAYGTPTERWTSVNNMPANAVLDAAAGAVGRRVVRRLDGGVYLERPETAWANADLQYRTFWQMTRFNNAGLPEGTVAAGGRVRESTIARAVPEAVRTVFGRKSGDTIVPGQFGIAIYLTQMGLSGYFDPSGNLYSGLTGFTGRFTADAYAIWPGSPVGDPSNLASLSSLAVRAAADWYGWRRGFIDVNWAGVQPWVPGGLDDEMRWSFTDGDVTTRVMREPYFNWNDYGYYPAVASGSASAVMLWGKVQTILSGQKYVLRQTVLSGTVGSPVWTDVSLVVTGFRADSKDYNEPVLPFIPVGQQTYMQPSPTLSGMYEIPAWGGQRKSVVRSLYGVCGHCDASGNIIVSALVQKIGTYARDLRTVRFPTGTPEYQIDLSGPGY